MRHQHQVGTKRSRLHYVHDVLHPERLGFARGGDDTGAIRTRERHDTDWPTAQLRAGLLFYAGEKSVEIQIKPFNGIGFAHGHSRVGGHKNKNRTHPQEGGGKYAYEGGRRIDTFIDFSASINCR